MSSLSQTTLFEVALVISNFFMEQKIIGIIISALIALFVYYIADPEHYDWGHAFIVFIVLALIWII